MKSNFKSKLKAQYLCGMITEAQYHEALRPSGNFHDRSLEGFRAILDDLNMQIKSVKDPEIKQKIQYLANPFYAEMKKLLQSYYSQGIGYGPDYHKNFNNS